MKEIGVTMTTIYVYYTNVEIYRFLTQTAPYTNMTLGPTEREACGGLGHAARARHIKRLVHAYCM